MKPTACLAAWTIACMAGCQSLPSAGVPARLVSPTAQCIAQIEQFAVTQTGQATRLGTPAFATGGVLLLDSAMARSSDGILLDGRNLGQPQQFSLSSRQGQCLIEHRLSNRQKELFECACVAGP